MSVLKSEVQTLFLNALSTHNGVVMLISLYNFTYQSSHCNALIFLNGHLEHFEPRGDIRSTTHTPLVRNFYDPRALLSFCTNLFQSFIDLSPSLCSLKRLSNDHFKNKPFDFSKVTDCPLALGIHSNDPSFPRAEFCAKLVFSYIRIRCGPVHHAYSRSDAHTEWLLYESIRHE